MKYNVGDKVRIKSLDWYNENINEIDEILCGITVFIPDMVQYVSDIVTISQVFPNLGIYRIKEDSGMYNWTDEMIEGLAEDESIIDLTVKGEEVKERIEITLPEGYEYVIESGKIIFTKKKKEYPKTYAECLKILGFTTLFAPKVDPIFDYDDDIIALQKLKNCRNAYWKIAGDEMGLGKPWEPEYVNTGEKVYSIVRACGTIKKNSICDFSKCYILEFPTEEMRDAFYENFKELIEQCKELL